MNGKIYRIISLALVLAINFTFSARAASGNAPMLVNAFDTFFTSTPTSPTNATNVSFSFDTNPSDPSVTFQCSIGGGAFFSCSSPFSYEPSQNTTSTFAVRSVDGNGNIEGTPATFNLTVDTLAPTVASITCLDSNPTSLTEIHFLVTFSDATGVREVDTTDFALTTSGIVGASIASVSGSGLTRTVQVFTGGGNGTIRLDVVDNDSITDLAGNPLGGVGAGNGDFSAGQTYTVMDSARPQIESITLASPNPTAASSVDFTVKFTEAVSGVDVSDFAADATGLADGTVSNVSGSGKTWTVTVDIAGSGTGTLGIGVVDDGSIVDLASNPLLFTLPGIGSYSSQRYDVDHTPPMVACIFTTTPQPFTTSTVTFYIGFDSCTDLSSVPVLGMDPGDFTVVMMDGVTGAYVSNVASEGSSSFLIPITVETGNGNGAIRIELNDDDTITDSAGNPLGGPGAGNGDFQSSVFTINKNHAPTDISLSVSSVNENLPAGTTIGSLSTSDADATDSHTYTFTCASAGTDDASFQISGDSLQTAAVFDFETKSSYSICIHTYDGNGGGFDKNFTITVNNVAETVTTTFKSAGTQDGWTLESGENSNAGGTLDVGTATLRLGDDATRKQYRSILSFNTSSLPDAAVITKVTLKVKRQGIVGGGNPVSAFQGFMVDIRKGFFGTAALQPTDWGATVSKTIGPLNITISGGWYTLDLTAAKLLVNKSANNAGLTQIRLRFKLDDNNNSVANYLSLHSGDASLASRPQLIIEYSLP